MRASREGDRQIVGIAEDDMTWEYVGSMIALADI